MPAQSVYAPLNGKEIRDILKKNACDVIDKTPLLRIGNTFHGAILEMGFKMSARPADVPVPKPYEVLFELEAPNFSDNPEAQEIVRRTEAYLTDLRAKKEEIDAKINAEITKYEDESFSFIDAGTPDQVRADHGLEIPMLERTAAGIKEIHKPASAVYFAKK